MNEAIDYSTVKWVKQELDATLKQARQALEAHVECPDDDSQLRFCSVHLHQVYGTLQMVELYGAALLAEEMEQVVEALVAGTVGQKEEAYELIMRGVLQLPDYLERIIAGHRDVPLVLLPLLNDLRAIRGQKLLSENSLFSPDITKPLPVGAIKQCSGNDIQTLARKQRHTYQLALLGWFRNKDTDQNLTRLHGVVDEIQSACGQPDCQRLWWIAGGLITALREGWLDTSMSTKLLLGQVDRQIKRLIDDGERSISEAPPSDLIKNLLFYIARSSNGGEPVNLIKATYNLSALLPDANELADAQTSLSGHNTELMATVSTAIKEDLARVKDALDLYLRGGKKTVADLQPAAETLARIGDTLGMLGLGALRKVAQKQAESAASMVAGRVKADETTLMDIASALLYVESSLDSVVLGDQPEPTEVDTHTDESKSSDMLPDAEFNQVRGVVADEAIRDIAQAKDAILAFMEESNNFELLDRVPQLFNQIKGGLLLLNEQRAAELINSVKIYIADMIMVPKSVPEEANLDDLADAISSIEYYLESIREGRVFGHTILDVASKSLERLGYEQNPVTDLSEDGSTIDVEDVITLETPEDQLDYGIDLNQEQTVGYTVDEQVDEYSVSKQMQDADVDIDISVGEDIFTTAPVVEDHLPVDKEDDKTIDSSVVQSSVPVTPPAMSMSEDIDEEILEIFIEESEEELANINEFLPRWLNNVDDRDALIDMRRSFHTLKGSGRLVGAIRIGEFAWAYENMLNRIIDGSIERNACVEVLLERVLGALPELIAQIRDNIQTTQPIEAMAALAEACSQGKAVDVSSLDTYVACVEAVVKEPSNDEPDKLDTFESADDSADVGVDSISIVDNVSSDDNQIVATHDQHADETGHDPFAMDEGQPSLEDEAAAISTEIDPVLYDIFSNESKDHVGTIRVFIEQCREAGPECCISDELLRALHTLHGSARMAGADAIAELAFEIEKYGKALRSDSKPMPAEGMELVAHAMRMIEDLLVDLNSPVDTAQEYAKLVDAIARLPRATESVAHIPSAEVPAEDLANYNSTDIDLQIDGLTEAIDLSLAEEFEPVSADTAIDDLGGDDKTTFSEESSDLLHDIHDDCAPIETSDTGELEQLNTVVRNDDALDDHHEIDINNDHALEDSVGDNTTRIASTGIDRTLQPSADGMVAFNYDLVDQDLLDVFLEEGEEILSASDSALHSWINSPDDTGLMVELQRHLHTLKGGARMANISAIGDLSHSLESLLIAVVDGLIKPDTRLFDTLLVAQDRLVHMVEAVRDHKPMHAAGKIIEQLDALRRGEPVPVHPDQSTREVQPIAVSEVYRSEDGPVEQFKHEEPAQIEDTKAIPRTQQELVRVRADLLDNMVNYAGEISIYRSRLEQQVGSMRFNLSEFGQTVDRLRDQLRNLEIETEAQVLFRYERDAGSADEQFDPLEMDRYSTLQQLSRSMMEGISDLVSIQGLLDNITRESETLLLQQSRVNTELQEGLMRTRMVPFAGLAPRMRRIVRQASQELGKRAEMILEGAEGEMDRTVIDRIIAPIEHMLRNAIAHGIETPDKRAAAGKSPTGSIKVSLTRDGSEVVITLTDDGAGMNLEAIRRKAKERGLVLDDVEYTDTDIMQFVLETGFSTAEEVSQIAGRGVGMDVVNSEVKQLGGSLHIDSKQGVGTTFTIRLPFTLAISQALLVQVHEEIYAIPLTGIEGIVRMTQDELSKYMNNADARFEYAGNHYPLHNLGEMLGQGAPVFGSGAPKRLPVLLIRSGDHRMALQVEALLGSRETVVKSVGPQISTVRGISGATILGDGRIVLILDLGGLLRSGGLVGASETVAVEPERKEGRPLLVMVVDDSITVRKVTTRLLERNEMEVITAKDGVDAVAKLQEHIPDLMLLDIEMPRMDGFELATHVRNEARLRNIPIIMITSRTGDKHRKRAMEIGVDRYLGKPFQETELLSTIQELAEERRSNG